MPRHVTKTYGRSDHTSNAFDEAIRRASGRDKVFQDVSKNKTSKVSTAMASSTIQRFGKTSFTSTRNNQVMESETRKRHLEEEVEGPSLFDDPFSFDSDDDGPSKPKKGMGFKKGKASTQKTSNNSQRQANGTNSKPAAKSYSKTTKNIKLSQQKTRDENICHLPVDSVNNKLPTTSNLLDVNNHKHLCIDVTAKSKVKKVNKKPIRAKFFTSKNSTEISPGSDDHNYSVSLIASQSQTRDDHNYSQSDFSGADRDSSGGADIWGSDYDSDWDIDNGNPEVTMTSQRRLLATKKIKDVVTDLHTHLGDSSSNVTENYDSVSLCSNGSAKSDHTDPILASDDDEVDVFSFKHRTVRTYGKGGSTDGNSLGSNTSEVAPGVNNTTKVVLGKSKSQSTNSQGSTISSVSDAGDMYAGLTSRPMMRKFSSLEEKKKEKPSKPLVRRLLTSPTKGSTKWKAVYNPRSWQSYNQAGDNPETKKTSGSTIFDDFEAEAQPVIKEPAVMKRTRIKPQQPWDDPSSSLKVTRQHKPLFTVVRNVKQAHECQEHGETQEFEDDIIYILDGVKDTESISTRCLSTISLASKCTMPAFRMHLRAHNTLIKVFSALQDSPKYPTLALCTAAVMYMFSRDRINMDIEQSTLELMLSLLSTDTQQMLDNSDKATKKEYDRLCHKICDIAKTMKKDGGVKNNKQLELDLNDVSIGNLAMETLLSLTGKTSGEWFKEELRTLGGLDHIVNTVSNCAEELDYYTIEPTDTMLEKCRKIDRCLRVLENVTYLNADNQQYLVAYNSSKLLSSLYRTLKVCENSMPFNEVEVDREQKVNKDCPGYTIYNCMLSVLRVLLNLTHDNVMGSTRLGQTEGLIPTILMCVLRVPQYIPARERFDILVLGIGLLVNMVEHCDANRQLLVSTKTVKPYGTLSVMKSQIESLEALALLFNQCHDAARLMEEAHDAELEEREHMADTHSSANQNSAQRDPHNKSGEWKESEAGLEWVIIPMGKDEEDPDKILKRGGTLREALKNHYNKDHFDDDDDEDKESDDLEILPTSQEEDENFTKALHKYGQHMEDSIVAAYVAILLGCIVQGNSHLADTVRDHMPGCSFDHMIRMLKKFLGFMNFTSASSNTGSKSIKRVIETLDALNVS